MNIMVFDVPAESGGALSVLKDFYNEIIESNDKSVNWIFVLSTPELNEYHNVKVLRFPWIKKSWLHRLFFDYVKAPKLIRQYKIDKVFSLQNVTVPRVKCKQILYVHQSLPFVDYKFSLISNIKFWLYQNVIGKFIFRSIVKAQKVIVQTNWMRDACIDKTKIDKSKIEVVPPKIEYKISDSFFPNKKSMSRFFYPASAEEYKNHRIIIDSCLELKTLNIQNYEVILTLDGNENKVISNLYNKVLEEQLPIKFIGKLSRDEVFKLYTESILLFPSYIETFGLPLLEAKLHNSIIFTSSTKFSYEILKDYENAFFFDPFNPSELTKLIKKSIHGHIEYKYQSNKLYHVHSHNDNTLLSSIMSK